jgi:hypothetical protein
MELIAFFKEEKVVKKKLFLVLFSIVALISCHHNTEAFVDPNGNKFIISGSTLHYDGGTQYPGMEEYSYTGEIISTTVKNNHGVVILKITEPTTISTNNGYEDHYELGQYRAVYIGRATSGDTYISNAYSTTGLPNYYITQESAINNFTVECYRDYVSVGDPTPDFQDGTPNNWDKVIPISLSTHIQNNSYSDYYQGISIILPTNIEFSNFPTSCSRSVFSNEIVYARP